MPFLTSIISFHAQTHLLNIPDAGNLVHSSDSSASDDFSDSDDYSFYTSEEELNIDYENEEVFDTNPGENRKEMNLFYAVTGGDIGYLSSILSSNNLIIPNINSIFNVMSGYNTTLLALAIGYRQWDVLDFLLSRKDIKIDTLNLAFINVLLEEEGEDVDIYECANNIKIPEINALLENENIPICCDYIDAQTLVYMGDLLKKQNIEKHVRSYISELKLASQRAVDLFIVMAHKIKSPYILWFVLNKYFSMNLDRDYLDSDMPDDEKYKFYDILLSDMLSPTFVLK